MRALGLSTRLVLGYLLVALLPMAGLSWFYLHTFERSLSATVLQTISSIADKKSDQIDNYINERLADARFYAGRDRVQQALRQISRDRQHTGFKTLLPTLQFYRAELATLGDRGEYHDVLLIDLNGDVVFSLRREDDLNTNLLRGPYRDTPLAQGFRQAMTFLHADLTRFEPYAPSQGQVAAFAVAPVLERGKAIGVLALQVNLETLMPVVTDATGLGASGETVLARRDADGVRFTVPLRHLPGKPFTQLLADGDVPGPMRMALAGSHGRGMVTDYAGVPVAASWAYLPALDWGMVVKMDAAEALAPLHAVQRVTALAFLLFLVLSALVAWWLGRRFLNSERIIAAQEARYRAMFGSMNDGVALYRPTPDGEFTVLDVNPAAEKITGTRLQDIRNLPSRQAYPGLEKAGIFAAFGRVHRHGGVEKVNLTDYHDGKVNLWVENDVMRLPGGEIMSVFRDVTARKQAEDALQLYANIFEHSGEAIMVTDRDNRIVAINPAFERQTGYSLKDIEGKNPRLLSAGRTPRETYQALWESLLRVGYWQGELWDRHRNGNVLPKWAAISVIRDGQGAITHHIASFTDISERKAAEERIEHLAHHDSLTGLFNRYNLEIRLSQALLSAHREGSFLAVMFIDLDRFKVINDTLGHQTGDRLLIEVARRLQACVRSCDIVARQGGDEFVVVLTGLSSVADASPVASKILAGIGQPYDMGPDRLYTSPSIGISVYPTDGGDAGTLLKNADAAMYHAKEQGRNNLQFFTAALNAAAAERLVLERELRTAIEEGQFELHYQPQVALDASAGSRPSAVEALVRWRHPQRGLVPPVRFIPIAEESGLIEVIGDWVLNEACRQLAEWKAAGIAPQRVAVNLSAHQLRNPALVSHIARALEHHGLRDGELEIEITESVAMSDPEGAIEKLRALRALGVTLAIDDFGTGYSSLAYLKKLPIQVLKLDREFVRDIETDENDAAISAATLALAHSLGLKVVAEGIETEGQDRFLRAHGCDLLQGYLFGRPEPASGWTARWGA